jgi:ribosome-associated protein
MTKTFELNGSEFIELNKLLKLLRMVNSGAEANICIERGDIQVNGTVETRKRNKLRAGDTVVVDGKTIVIQ